MDTNQIRKDGFSNPETERESKAWKEQGREMALIEANKNCGSCLFNSFIVDSPEAYHWLLCLNEDSPRHLETLRWTYCCDHHQRDFSVTYIPVPPEAPLEFLKAHFDLGLEEEGEEQEE